MNTSSSHSSSQHLQGHILTQACTQKSSAEISNAMSKEVTDPSSPRLAGWIIALMFISVVASPISQALMARFEMQALASYTPQIIQDPLWIRYLATVITRLLASITLAVFIFLGLIMLKRFATVRFAIIGLWLLWPVALLFKYWQSIHFVDRYFAENHNAQQALAPTFPFLLLAIGGLIALGWTVYFLQSKQVRLTYPIARTTSITSQG